MWLVRRIHSTYQLMNSAVDGQTTYTDSNAQSGATYEYYVTSVEMRRAFKVLLRIRLLSRFPNAYEGLHNTKLLTLHRMFGANSERGDSLISSLRGMHLCVP